MLLSCDHLIMRFGGLVAVNEVSLQVARGEIYGLIGPNGSGKTTMFNMISGIFRPTAGKIILGHKDITGKRPDFITHHRVGRTFQNIRLFANMTAGHQIIIVLLTGDLIGVSWMLSHGFWKLAAPGPLVGAIIMDAFEIFVAFIQAFIFALLTALYLGEALEESH